jgi:hypothetical protein
VPTLTKIQSVQLQASKDYSYDDNHTSHPK